MCNVLCDPDFGIHSLVVVAQEPEAENVKRQMQVALCTLYFNRNHEYQEDHGIPEQCHGALLSVEDATEHPADPGKVALLLKVRML